MQTETGKYEADFFLYFTQAAVGVECPQLCPYPEGRDFCGGGCKRCPPTTPSPLSKVALDQCRLAPLFANSVGAIEVQSINKIEANINTTNQYRVQGTFLFGGTDISNWPFETEQLNITLEDPNRDVSKLVFRPMPEYSGVSSSAISPGWDVRRRTIACPGNENNRCDVSFKTASTVAHPGRTGNFSRFTFFVEVRRPSRTVFLKDVLPFFLILLPQYYSFSMPISAQSTRASIAASGLVSALLLHISVSSKAPVVGQLLFIDRFLLVVYIIIIFNLVCAILVMKADASKQRQGRLFCCGLDQLCKLEAVPVRDLHHWAELVGWLLTPTFFLFPFFSLSDALSPAAADGIAVTIVLLVAALVACVGLRRQRDDWHSLCSRSAFAELEEGTNSGEGLLKDEDPHNGDSHSGLQMSLVANPAPGAASTNDDNDVGGVRTATAPARMSSSDAYAKHS